jgi:cytochrome c-type biogenesis protein CcmE
MTRKSRRLWLVGGCLLGFGAATGLTLQAFSANIVFFMAPSQILEHPPAAGRTIRLGGMVVAGSLIQNHAAGREPSVQFQVTDGQQAVRVRYVGILPDLFREGQGVVIEGNLASDGTFRAAEVLAKHDENYMPKEVVDALKKSGHWQETGSPQPRSAAQ